ncbi:hypothetical protein SAICODRAFT_22813 [Saitoella complicata NRRL Y-17804]|nr:uncharacterized protein SAICODRAFT_22813 [Saitoella complicata NRRL Y-17804]ODQ56446.1 hypothetical protein SAICODRAFT_22813 [Saitoella complicata NRRL Y-17804]
MILGLAHFCEQHGPSIVFCTQAIPEDYAGQTGLTPSTSTAAATAANSTCAACAFTVPKSLGLTTTDAKGVAIIAPPVLRTTDPESDASGGKMNYMSMRYPKSHLRYTALRQACVRGLSCELLPGRSGPVMFGDPEAGYAIAHVFRLPDPRARGSNRFYSLIALFEDDAAAAAAWTFVTERFAALVEHIRSRARTATTAQSTTQGIGTRPEGFLRRREGTTIPRGLPELTGLDDVFVQMHASFAWMLSILRKRWEGPAEYDSAVTESTIGPGKDGEVGDIT